jgi:hypothetical protein
LESLKLLVGSNYIYGHRLLMIEIQSGEDSLKVFPRENRFITKDVFEEICHSVSDSDSIHQFFLCFEKDVKEGILVFRVQVLHLSAEEAEAEKHVQNLLRDDLFNSPGADHKRRKKR